MPRHCKEFKITHAVVGVEAAVSRGVTGLRSGTDARLRDEAPHERAFSWEDRPFV